MFDGEIYWVPTLVQEELHAALKCKCLGGSASYMRRILFFDMLAASLGELTWQQLCEWHEWWAVLSSAAISVRLQTESLEMKVFHQQLVFFWIGMQKSVSMFACLSESLIVTRQLRMSVLPVTTWKLNQCKHSVTTNLCVRTLCIMI